MKKSISLLLVLTMLLAAALPSMAEAPEDRFAPQETLTRETCVTILWRYAESLGLTGWVSPADLSSYTDAGEISGDAPEAFAWALSAGIVDSGVFELDPQAPVTASQLEGMLRIISGFLLAERQTLSLSGIRNARDLGGYPTEDGRTVKRGVLLRTARLHEATEEDLQRLTSVYHLGVVVDFRGAEEAEETPDPAIEGVEYRNIDILGNGPSSEAGLAMDAEIAMLEAQGVEVNTLMWQRLSYKYGMFSDHMYVNYLSSEGVMAGYRQFFREILALPEGKALLFHCTAGKDRTGCGAMLLLFALGVDGETVRKEYMLTNTFNASLIAKGKRKLRDLGIFGEEQDGVMSTMMLVYDETVPNAVAWMTENYGSPLGYITQALGVTEEEIRTLRDCFLE